MALTVSVISSAVHGDDRVVVADITFDSSYPTGGEDLIPRDVGLANEIYTVQAEPTSGRLVAYDRTTRKLKAFDFDYNNAADGPAIEVPNATNLATTSVRALIVGN